MWLNDRNKPIGDPFSRWGTHGPSGSPGVGSWSLDYGLVLGNYVAARRRFRRIVISFRCNPSREYKTSFNCHRQPTGMDSDAQALECVAFTGLSEIDAAEAVRLYRVKTLQH